MNTPIRPSIGVGVYICHAGKVLVFKRTAKHGAGTWSPPGGHQEFGEHWEQTAVREAQEEVGLAVHSPQLFAITNDYFADQDKHYVTLHVAVRTDTSQFTNNEPEKQQDIGWRAWEDIPEPRMPPLQNVFNENKKPPYLI